MTHMPYWFFFALLAIIVGLAMWVGYEFGVNMTCVR